MKVTKFVPNDGRGPVTVGDLRRLLMNRKIPDAAVVCLCVEGFGHANMTEAMFDAPTSPNEGELVNFLLRPDPSSEIGRVLYGPEDKEPDDNFIGVQRERITVDVKFRGSVCVLVPVCVPSSRRRPLAEKVVLSRILATTVNPDAPESESCDKYADDHDLSEEQAGDDWDGCQTDGVGGEWMTDQTGMHSE